MPEFSPELFDKVCERIAEGESLLSICKDADMPARNTVFTWIRNDDELRDKYARAREAQADKIFEECLAIADSQEGDVIEVDGQERVNHDAIARAKLRIDTRKWMAGKLRPKVYGDKLDLGGNVGFTVTISGDDADL